MRPVVGIPVFRLAEEFIAVAAWSCVLWWLLR